MLITDHLKEQNTMTEIEQSISQYFLNHEQEIETISMRKIAN